MLSQVAHAPARPVPAAAGRYRFLSTAVLFVLVAVAGFAPRSAGILAGVLPNPPLAVHLHALLMCTWLLLLLLQTTFIAGRNKYLHIQLGLSTLALVPAIWLAMVVATLQTFSLMQQAGMGGLAANILLLQLRSLLLFPLFVWWAWRTARSDKPTHKRMMLLATFVVIDAAIGRMDWLPGNDLSQRIAPMFCYHFLLLVPVLGHELLHERRLHPAWLGGLALYLPWVVVTCLLWNDAAWQGLAARLLGY